MPCIRIYRSFCMVSFENAAVGVMLLYGGGALAGIGGMLARCVWLRRLAATAVAAGFILQTATLLLGSHASFAGGLSWGAYLQMLAWFVVLCGLGGWWKLRSDAAPVFTAPLALILFLMSWRSLDMHIRLPESITGPFYALHIGSLYLSLALMALAFGAGLLFIYLENKIKTKTPLTGFRKDFPALSILDKVNALTAVVGFPLFTVGMLSGFVWAGSTWGATVSGDPKEVVSIVAWILYAWLFHMRVVQGRRGRKPAMLAMWLFALCVFSIIVVNSFMETHHSFKRQ